MTDVETLHETETLRLTLDTSHIAVLTLTRPDLMNRFDAVLHDDYLAALAVLRRQHGVRVAVLASTGKVFSAGGDFDFMLQGKENLPFLWEHADVGRRLVQDMIEPAFPFIAALQGSAIGLGATMALCCDMVVAAKGVQIADPHVNIGLVAGDGGCLVWPVAAGSLMRAKRYLLTGDRLSAEDAYVFGLVTDLVDTPEDALPAAMALARKVAALPPLAVQGTRKALNNMMKARAAEVLDVAMAYELTSTRSDDLSEAIAAFRERRPGVYHGR